MTPFDHQVRERAYYIWENEGRAFGQAETHWLRAETELKARPSHEPVRVQAVAPALTLAPSPAAVLAETLKAKPSRTRSVTATVDGKIPAASKAPAKAKAPAKSAASAKSAATAKAAAEPAPKAAAKPAAKAAKAPKAASRVRATESVATVH